MRRLTRLRFPSRFRVLIVLAWIVGVEVGAVALAMLRWRDARAERRGLEARREVLAAGEAVLSPAALEKAAVDRGRAEAAVQAWRQACGVRLVSAAPTSRSRAFFEVAGWVEHLRETARAHGVACRPDERFGFGSYARQGPALDALGRVHRQREAAGALLEALFEAGPHGFERLQRGDPLPSGSRTADGREETDYFGVAEEDALSLPADTEAETFRITFAAHTRALRHWLNRLAEMPGPVVVRDLKVEPVSATDAGSDAMRITVVVQVMMPDRVETVQATGGVAMPASQ